MIVRTPAGRGSWAGRHLQIGALVGGLVCTALIAGALAFSNAQASSTEQQLARIDREYSQPLGLLDAAQTDMRQSQQTFTTATPSTTSSQQTAAVLQEALSQSEQGQRQWAQFKAGPVRFTGEAAARTAVDAAISANKQSGERLGVALLANNPDTVLVAQLEAAQATTSN